MDKPAVLLGYDNAPKRVDLQRANLLQAATLKKKLPVCEFLGLRSGVDKPAVLLGYDKAPLDKYLPKFRPYGKPLVISHFLGSQRREPAT